MKSAAVISLTLLTVVSADDGCENRYDYLCGDVCIDQYALCHCGIEVQIYLADQNSYCCIPPGDRQQCYQTGGR